VREVGRGSGMEERSLEIGEVLCMFATILAVPVPKETRE